ncbi:hypothetical protein VKT23_013715 [Stygiomarasmius scandens]|uniref:DUF8212 domain-containing protein n=1 Tax=Marasmiellus scandens TaxID=2682957 RepID=A0ABR1J2L5_9AGAR
MYGYYRNSRICFAYLADVSGTGNPRQLGSDFRRSRWFRRGWTLQELLAPLSLVFFNHDWEYIGSKSSLKVVISEVTGIPIPVLLYNHPGAISIATRMSWAVQRETTRAEDLAYCLMGIFDVNMPTLYGEGGPNAFIRLQQEIIKFSDDQSIFAWTAHTPEQRGLFARSPSEFRCSGDIQVSDELEETSPYAMTSRGLRIELPLVNYMGHILAILRCRRKGAQLGIYLHREKGNQYIRESPEQAVIWYPWLQEHHPSRTEVVYIKEKDSSCTKWNLFLSGVASETTLDIKLLPSLKKFIHFKMVGKATTNIRGVLLKRRQECFVLFVGVQEHVTWLHLITRDPLVQELAYMHYKTPLPVGTIERIWDQLSYHAIQQRSELIRLEKSLNSKEMISVTVREIDKNSQSCYVAEVGIINRSGQKDEDDSYYVPPEYDFYINWAQVYTFSLEEVYPVNVCRKFKATMSFISTKLKAEPCVLVFSHEETKNTFAVVLRVLDSEVWSDIFQIDARETAESVSQRVKDRSEISTSRLVIAGNTFEVSAGRKECLVKGHDLWARILESSPFSGTGDNITNPPELQPGSQSIHGIIVSSSKTAQNTFESAGGIRP